MKEPRILFYEAWEKVKISIFSKYSTSAAYSVKRTITFREKYKMMSLRRLCVSTKNGDKICQTKAEIIEMIKQCAALPKGDELWVSRNEKPYPCLSILIKENYACVHYFNNNEG